MSDLLHVLFGFLFGFIAAYSLWACGWFKAAPVEPPIYTEFNCMTASYMEVTHIGKGRRYPNGTITVPDRWDDQTLVIDGKAQGHVSRWTDLDKPAAP